MATHTSILAWRLPWTEEPGGLQSMGLQRAWHDWVTKYTHMCLLEEWPICFQKWLHHFTLLPAMHQASSFTASSSTLVIFCHFGCGHPSGWEVLSPLCFAFPWWRMIFVVSIFSCAYWPIAYLLWWDVFSNPLSIFMLLSYKICFVVYQIYDL